MSQITLKVDGKVAYLKLDNAAKLNCLTTTMLRQLESHIDVLECLENVRLCVLQAQPSGAFCAGADINEWSALGPAQFSQNWLQWGNRIFDRFAQLPMPTIACLEAPAFGGGLELIACCDLRLATRNCTFSLPETGLGVIPGWSGTQRLARLLPETTLKSMLLFGTAITAAQAQVPGFVEIATDMQLSLEQKIEDCMARSPAANRIAKMMLHGARGENTAVMISALGGGFASAGVDKVKGVEAFSNKSRAEF